MKKLAFYSILFLPLIACFLTSLLSVQFLFPTWLKEMWGDGIVIASSLIGLGLSKLWVSHLDQSGNSARISAFIGFHADSGQPGQRK
jgi:hypothetical protein